MASARTAKAAEAKADAAKHDDDTNEETVTTARNPNDTGSDPLAGEEVETTVVSQPAAPQLPLTVRDEANDVDRIISTPTAKWEPAPVDPDPAEVKRLEQFHKDHEERQEEARKPLSERNDGDEKDES